MVIRSLDVKKNPFRPSEEGEELLGPKVPNFSAIEYLANCTQLDIAFSVNLLTRYSSTLPRRHWNNVKHIFRYLCETIDFSLFYPKESKSHLVGYIRWISL